MLKKEWAQPGARIRIAREPINNIYNHVLHPSDTGLLGAAGTCVPLHLDMLMTVSRGPYGARDVQFIDLTYGGAEYWAHWVTIQRYGAVYKEADNG